MLVTLSVLPTPVRVPKKPAPPGTLKVDPKLEPPPSSSCRAEPNAFLSSATVEPVVMPEGPFSAGVPAGVASRVHPTILPFVDRIEKRPQAVTRSGPGQDEPGFFT